MKGPLKIVIADDHSMIRQAIVSFLQDYINEVLIVGEAGNGEDLLKVLGKVAADIVLLDLNMPGYDGMECLQKIKDALGQMPTMIVF